MTGSKYAEGIYRLFNSCHGGSPNWHGVHLAAPNHVLSEVTMPASARVERRFGAAASVYMFSTVRGKHRSGMPWEEFLRGSSKASPRRISRRSAWMTGEFGRQPVQGLSKTAYVYPRGSGSLSWSSYLLTIDANISHQWTSVRGSSSTCRIHPDRTSLLRKPDITKKHF